MKENKNPMEEYTPKSLGEAISKGYREGTEYNTKLSERKHRIAERLMRLRFEHKISQSKLCEEIKVNRITYSGYEAERAEPRAEVFVRLADYYDVSVDYLVCRTDNPKGLYFDSEDSSVSDLQKKIDEVQKQLDALKQGK